MKGILAIFIVIISSLSITFNSDKQISDLTIGMILLSFAGMIGMIMIAINEGKKVSFAEANK